MKKLPILLLILIANLVATQVFSAKTQALVKDSSGRTWWTVSELLDYKTVIDEEANALCGSDEDCLNNYRKLKLSEDGEKYSALGYLKIFQLMPTEVNFQTGTIKILLFDENMVNGGSSGRPKNGVIVNEMAIWISDNNPTGAIGGRRIEGVLKGEYPGVYPLFGFTRESSIELAKDREAEYPMLSADFGVMTNRGFARMELSFRTNYFNKSTNTGFSSCTTAAGYLEGKCVLMVSSTKEFHYKFIRSLEEGESPVDNEALSDGKEISGDNVFSDDKKPIVPSDNGPTDIIDTDIPRAPDTGSIANFPNCQKVIEFPWWILILITLGDVAVLWLFWPKSQKTTKKLLTKRKKCDKMGTV